MGKVLMCVLFLALSGCKDKYQEGYGEGFSIGYAQAKAEAQAACSLQVDAAKESYSSRTASPSYSFVTAEVCGGNGMDYNGKHYKAGKTGCVRVMADGRVEGY